MGAEGDPQHAFEWHVHGFGLVYYVLGLGFEAQVPGLDLGLGLCVLDSNTDNTSIDGANVPRLQIPVSFWLLRALTEKSANDDICYVSGVQRKQAAWQKTGQHLQFHAVLSKSPYMRCIYLSRLPTSSPRQAHRCTPHVTSTGAPPGEYAIPDIDYWQGPWKLASLFTACLKRYA